MLTNTLLDNTIDLCARSGIDALKRAKFAWWPTEGEADSSEDNLWFHVGCALQIAGFHVYAKAQVAGVPQQHVDAVALHRDYRCAVVIEAKRLYSTEKHASLGNDWLRLQRIKLPCEWLQFPQPLNCYALLIGSSWNEEHIQWWIDPMRGPVPAKCRESDAWLNIRSALQGAVRLGAVDVQRPGWLPHWICFSINRFPDNHWCAVSEGSQVVTVTGA